MRVLVALLAVTGCGDDSAASGADDAGVAGTDAATRDAATHFTRMEASDPCEAAGYVFDGESDCNVIRCPELICECPAAESTDPDDPPAPPLTVTLGACVPAKGCLSLADCTRVCNPSVVLAREACEQRIAAAGPEGCARATDCLRGECRGERVGSLCVDALGCSEDGHCSEGSACLFDPDTLDPQTAFPTTLGTCADGRADSRCYDDGDCVYGHCNGERCTGGLDGESCAQNANCASSFCRITDVEADTGSCVGGARGDSCFDDGDCGEGLHCTGAVCFGGEVGQHCEGDDQCDAGICVSGRCRAGGPGSYCEDDGDCVDGYCVGAECASGLLLSPCVDDGDCGGGLSCARRACSDGSAGMPCTTDDECEVLACVGGACSTGELGAECDDGPDCQSGRCANPAGVEAGACTSGEPGSRCVYDDHCLSSSCNGNGVCD